MLGKENMMEPIKKDNEKIEEIKDIEKNEMKELSDEVLEGVAGGVVDYDDRDLVEIFSRNEDWA